MVYIGSAIMIVNIVLYVRFERQVTRQWDWKRERLILDVPIVLLILFLLGYLAVGIFGKPDLIMSAILLGGLRAAA